ncbi:hypothetical protein IQ07DRAFT_598121 [Pyrenochaeta sp. DS3sAY3a]|nr:hypothetical protein IQ07DRAFT_598121 [Pyrenochaeta sp. DS3sAY3a]
MVGWWLGGGWWVGTTQPDLTSHPNSSKVLQDTGGWSQHDLSRAKYPFVFISIPVLTRVLVVGWWVVGGNHPTRPDLFSFCTLPDPSSYCATPVGGAVGWWVVGGNHPTLPHSFSFTIFALSRRLGGGWWVGTTQPDLTPSHPPFSDPASLQLLKYRATPVGGVVWVVGGGWVPLNPASFALRLSTSTFHFDFPLRLSTSTSRRLPSAFLLGIGITKAEFPIIPSTTCEPAKKRLW